MGKYHRLTGLVVGHIAGIGNGGTEYRHDGEGG